MSKHPHRCKRWERHRLRCPFSSLPEHEEGPDDDDNGGGGPPLPPARSQKQAKAAEQASPLELDAFRRERYVVPKENDLPDLAVAALVLAAALHGGGGAGQVFSGAEGTLTSLTSRLKRRAGTKGGAFQTKDLWMPGYARKMVSSSSLGIGSIGSYPGT